MSAIKPPQSVVPAVEPTLNRKAAPLSKNPEAAAEQFEGMLLKQMIDSMWSTVPKDGLLSGSNEEGMYRDLLNEALAKSISEGKGIGVKDVILKDFKKLSKTK